MTLEERYTEGAPTIYVCATCQVTFTARAIPAFPNRFCDPCAEKGQAAHAKLTNAPTAIRDLLDEIPGDLRDFNPDKLNPTAKAFHDSGQTTGRLVLCGATGRGKTYVVASMMQRRAQQGKKSCYVMATAIRDMKMPSDDPIQRQRNRDLDYRLKNAAWVAIDDIGHGNWSMAFAETMLDILKHRKALGKSTILTCNWAPKDWPQHLKGAADPATLSAIVRRVVEAYMVINL